MEPSVFADTPTFQMHPLSLFMAHVSLLYVAMGNIDVNAIFNFKLLFRS